MIEQRIKNRMKNRTILKNLTVSWSYLTDEEKERKTSQHSLSEEELKYITQTRQQIEKKKKKVFSY